MDRDSLAREITLVRAYCKQCHFVMDNASLSFLLDIYISLLGGKSPRLENVELAEQCSEASHISHWDESTVNIEFWKAATQHERTEKIE